LRCVSFSPLLLRPLSGPMVLIRARAGGRRWVAVLISVPIPACPCMVWPFLYSISFAVREFAQPPFLWSGECAVPKVPDPSQGASALVIALFCLSFIARRRDQGESGRGCSDFSQGFHADATDARAERRGAPVRYPICTCCLLHTIHGRFLLAVSSRPTQPKPKRYAAALPAT
jgi:hypothetical protein